MTRLGIRIESKSFRRGRAVQQVLGDVNFDVGEAEIVGVYGLSGCGKSTVLRIAAALDQDFIGKITLDGRTITAPTRDVGITIQGDASFGWLNLLDNILWPLGLSGSRDVREAHRLAEMVGLASSDLSKYPHEVSAGMKQRMVLARALAAKPKVLLLDEPFSSLDYEARTALQELVLTIRSAARVAFVCVTHDPEEALYLADRLVVLAGAPATVVERVPGVVGPRVAGFRSNAAFHKRINDLRSLLRSDDATTHY